MLRLIGNPQQQPAQTITFTQQQQFSTVPYSKPTVQRVSSPIYQLNEPNRPF